MALRPWVYVEGILGIQWWVTQRERQNHWLLYHLHALKYFNITLLLLKSLYICLLMFCVHVCVCIAWCSWGPQGVSDLLELEVSVVLSHHVDAWNQTRVFWKSNKCAKLLSHLLVPLLCSIETRCHCVAKVQPYKSRDSRGESPHPARMLWFKGVKELWIQITSKFRSLLGLPNSTSLLFLRRQDCRLITAPSLWLAWDTARELLSGHAYKLPVYVQISF